MNNKVLKISILVMLMAVGTQATVNTCGYAGPKQPETDDYGQVVSEEKELSVWTCSSGWKVGRSWKIPRGAAHYVTISLAKNERESVQIILTPSVDLSDVKISVSDLRNGENTLASGDIDILQVSYLNITDSSDGAYPTGYWPDPLLPVKNPLALEKDINHPFWIRVHAPTELPAGNYEGLITISADQITQKIPLKVMVFNFTLPDVMTCKSAFGSRFREVPVYHKLQSDEQKAIVFDKYLTSFAEHHISPYNPTPMNSYNVEFSVPKDLNRRMFKEGKIVHNESHSGENSLFIEDHDTTKNVYVESVRFSTQGAKALRISFWYRTILPDQLSSVRIIFFDSNNKEIGENSPIFLGNGKWQHYVHTVPDSKVTKGTEYVRLRFTGAAWNVSGCNTGEVWIDDLKLYALNPTRLLTDEREGTFETSAASYTKEEYDNLQEKIQVDLDADAWIKALKMSVEKYHFNSFQLRIKGMGGLTWQAVNIPSFNSKEGSFYKEYSLEYEILYGKFITQLTSALEKKGLLDEAYAYMYDEPDSSQIPFIKRNYARLKRYAPDLTTILPIYSVRDSLKDEMDVWVMVLNAVKGMQYDPNEEYWSYVCTAPHAPFPGTFIDHPGIDLRIWLWQSFARNLKGILIWETMYWRSDGAKFSSPYLHPMSSSGNQGWNWGNGDGRFIYPPQECFDNKDDKPILEGPVDSIRWEMLRDGIEDYEYLTILRKQLKRLPADSELRKKYQKLLILPKNITSLTEYTKNPADIENLRKIIAKTIEKDQYHNQPSTN